MDDMHLGILPAAHIHFLPISSDTFPTHFFMHFLVGFPLFHPKHSKSSFNPSHSFFANAFDISRPVVIHPTPEDRIQEPYDNLYWDAAISLGNSPDLILESL